MVKLPQKGGGGGRGGGEGGWGVLQFGVSCFGRSIGFWVPI